MIERMPKGWPYERLKYHEEEGGAHLVAGVFAVSVMVIAMALATMGAW